MRINLLKEVSEVFCGLKELESELGLKNDIDGINIEAGGGNESCATFGENTLKITYAKKAHFYRLLRLFLQSDKKEGFYYKIDTSIQNIGIMADCSRNAVYKVSTVKKLVRKMALMGYTYLELYTEDTYEVENEPYFGYFRGRFSANEIKEIDAYCKIFGIELIPCIQGLAHLNQIFRWNPYSGILDCNDILLADNERTYELLENIFLTLSKNFTSKKVNIGMDEAHMVGLGKYLDNYGYKDRFEIINKHIERILKIADKYGFKLSMWSDMYFRLAFSGDYYSDKPIDSAILEKVPSEIELIYWDYYSTDVNKYRRMLESHLKFNNQIAFAGGAWKWIGFAPDNRYSMAISKSALTAAKEKNIKKVALTCWGDNGAEASIFSVLPSMIYFADMCYDFNCDLESAIKVIANSNLSAFLTIDLANRLSDSLDPKEINCSAKYLLYNDYFMGVFDSAITESCKDIYDKNLALLECSIEQTGEFAYLIETQIALLEVIRAKYDIGIVTRLAYKKGDKQQLLKIANTKYTLIYELIKKFYDRFAHQWHLENKANGFDIQDLRLGGLMQRTLACKSRLLDFCNGNIDCIEELEEDVLDFDGNIKEFIKSKEILFNNWQLISTTNVI